MTTKPPSGSSGQGANHGGAPEVAVERPEQQPLAPAGQPLSARVGNENPAGQGAASAVEKRPPPDEQAEAADEQFEFDEFPNLVLSDIPRVKTRPVPTVNEARFLIAKWLVTILAFVVCAGVLLYVFNALNGADSSTLKDLLAIIFGPVVTLVGSATGFYFGERSGERAAERREENSQRDAEQ